MAQPDLAVGLPRSADPAGHAGCGAARAWACSRCTATGSCFRRPASGSGWASRCWSRSRSRSSRRPCRCARPAGARHFRGRPVDPLDQRARSEQSDRDAGDGRGGGIDVADRLRGQPAAPRSGAGAVGPADRLAGNQLPDRACSPGLIGRRLQGATVGAAGARRPGALSICWRRSARAAWAKSGRPATRCSRGRRRSSWCGRGRPHRRRGRRICGSSGSAAKRTSSPDCSRRTRSISTILASRAMGSSITSMELLDGINLQTLVTTFGPQPVGRVRSIALQICASLGEAHQQNLVHRDLKPSNVMLCKLALTYDFVKVLDFGLAKCAACEDVLQLTMEGTAAGTPGYIAPEVALGEDRVDGRADIYALGCVVYFLLTGTLVFPDSNPMTMALKHVPGRSPIRRRRARSCRSPPTWKRIVMRCLEKKPDDRPSSAREVALAARGLLLSVVDAEGCRRLVGEAPAGNLVAARGARRYPRRAWLRAPSQGGEQIRQLRPIVEAVHAIDELERAAAVQHEVAAALRRARRRPQRLLAPAHRLDHDLDGVPVERRRHEAPEFDRSEAPPLVGGPRRIQQQGVRARRDRAASSSSAGRDRGTRRRSRSRPGSRSRPSPESTESRARGRTNNGRAPGT